MKTLFKEAIGYGAASAGALAVDILVLWILVRYFDWWYLAAATTSFFAGALIAYALSLKLAFKHHRLRNQHVEFVSFVAIGILGLGVNAAVIFLAVHYFGLHYLFAKCMAAGATFVCNFVSRRQLLFVSHSTLREI